jgi:hypothetical protein
VRTEGPGFSGPGPSAYLRSAAFEGYTSEMNGVRMFLSTDNEVCLLWLEGALQQLHPEGQKKVVGYLEAVLEEVVFEAKMVPEAYPRGVTYPTEGV